MGRRNRRVVTAAALALLAAGCAARFSADTVRSEITRQRGHDPLSVFELNLGRFTTLLLKSALAGEDGELPFDGVRELQLAVYESPGEASPALDVTRFDVRGWEPVVRAHDRGHSALILVRSGGALRWRRPVDGSIGDLVVVGAGRRKVVYARLRGTLRADLPSALRDVLRRGGPEEVSRVLTELAEP